MNKQLLKQLQEYKDKKNAYDAALSTMYYDIATIAPKDGISYRNRMVSILSGESFTHETNPQSIAMLEALAGQNDIDDVLKKEVSLLLKDLENVRFLPKEVFVDFVQITADSQNAWEKAKAANDYSIFKPHLIKVIKKQKETLSYIKKDGSDYDYLLNRFQDGLSTKIYDVFFDQIKKELLPFIQRLIRDGKKIDDRPLFERFDITKQRAFMDILLKHLQYNPKKCYITTSEHPFTDFFSANEARITTHYLENNVMSAIFSTIHEYGHANYGLHVNPDFEGSTLANDIGFAMHESQSRFMENNLARRPSFWKPLYPKLQELFPAQLSNIDLSTFMSMVNVSRPSFIRTEADELTYPIHILIRYELEKEIFNDTIDYERLDTLWNDKYEEYLGIRPTNDRDGILQDMHWGGASLGYFPTYALGSAYAAQFYHQMEQELCVDTLLENGDFTPIYDWLEKNIHRFGAYKSADQIMLDTTKEPFDVSYYITYLKTKFAKLYNIVA